MIYDLQKVFDSCVYKQIHMTINLFLKVYFHLLAHIVNITKTTFILGMYEKKVLKYKIALKLISYSRIKIVNVVTLIFLTWPRILEQLGSTLKTWPHSASTGIIPGHIN